MSSTRAPNIKGFYAGAAIAKGKAVKIGADNDHVIECGAATDKAIGIAQNACTGAEDLCEVAMPGGGAKALAQTTIDAGMLLVPHTDGKVKPIAASGNRIIAVAQESAVANDLFDVDVIIGQAVATES